MDLTSYITKFINLIILLQSSYQFVFVIIIIALSSISQKN